MRLKQFMISLALLINLLLGTAILLTVPAYAATAEACSTSSAGVLSFPTWYKYLTPTFDAGDPTADPPRPSSCKVTFPNNDIKQAIGPILLAVFEIILRVAAILAVIFVIWGGIQYQLSQGEPERISKARSVILNALIGLAITLSATAIVNLVGRNIV